MSSGRLFQSHSPVVENEQSSTVTSREGQMMLNND